MRFAQIVCASLVAAFIAAPSGASAQDVQALQQQIDQLKKDVAALQAQLAALQTAQPAAAPPAAAPPAAEAPAAAAGAGAPGVALPQYGASGASVGASKVFNPDMAVIGDFLGAVGSNPVQPDPFSLGADHPNALQMHESEASFQAIVDPYARADFFISFGEQGVDLEEGFVTFTSLPGGLLTRVGKMRAAFGKVNSLHNHVLPWADRPLVMYNLVGGEDGIDDAGISVARLIPNPWLFLEATGQVFRGDSGGEGSPLFATTKRSELSYVGHLRGYQDITEDANIDLGFSYSYGHNGIINPNGDGSLTTQLYGVDGTFRWRPLQRSIYHSFVGRSEWIWSRRDQTSELGGLQVANGGYVSADYQLGRRWFTGVRLDRSGHPDNASITDTGASLLLTYWPSEFSQIRGQYRRTNYGVGATANELLFQFQFSIGAHGAHPF
jgi:hypothetical protein